MRTHYLVKNSDEWYSAQGVDDWFWWDICLEYGMWQVSSIFGRKHGEYSRLLEALRSIGYESDCFDESPEDSDEYVR